MKRLVWVLMAITVASCGDMASVTSPGSILLLPSEKEFAIGNDEIRCAPNLTLGFVKIPYKFGTTFTVPGGTAVKVISEEDAGVIVEVTTDRCDKPLRSTMTKEEFVKLAEEYARLKGKPWQELQKENRDADKREELLRKAGGEKK